MRPQLLAAPFSNSLVFQDTDLPVKLKLILSNQNVSKRKKVAAKMDSKNEQERHFYEAIDIPDKSRKNGNTRIADNVGNSWVIQTVPSGATFLTRDFNRQEEMLPLSSVMPTQG